MKITVHSLSCTRCGHSWVPRKPEVRVCPKCHSPYWDRGSRSVQPVLDEVIRRIVKSCDPDKIVLFGSHASGRASPDSDVDLLVVVPVEGSRRDKATEIDVALYGIPMAVDTIVVTPTQLERSKRVRSGVIHTAVSEGRTLYERAA